MKNSEIQIKSPKKCIKDEFLVKNNNNFIDKNEIFVNKEEKTLDLIRKTSQEKDYIQDLLGKINNCLSKTTNLLNKPINEAKNAEITEEKISQKKLDFFENKISEKFEISQKKLDFPKKILQKNLENCEFQQNSQKFSEEKNFEKLEFLQENHQKNFEEFNELKITISPVKEVLLESNDATMIQNQINEEKTKEKSNSIENSKKYEEIVIFEKNAENTDFLQKKTCNFINNDLIFEDKENNGPFINVYHNKSSLSKENSEILKESYLKNIVKNDEFQQESQENPYNMQIITKILQSNSEEISNIQRNSEEKNQETRTKKEKFEEIPIKKEKLEEIQIKRERFPIKKEKIEEVPIKIEKIEEISREKFAEFPIKNEKINEFPLKTEKIDDFPINNQIIDEFPIKNQKIDEFQIKNQKIDEFPIKSENSYARIAQKNQKNKELQAKQSQILQQITNIDKEIQTMELDSQKSKISDKMLRFKDNYKAYKHKLPSIQENDDSLKRKSQISEKTHDFHKKSTKKLEIVQERCEKLYLKGVESSQRRIKEFDENLKKSEELQRNLCPFKPEFIAKKANQTILSQREKAKKDEEKMEKNDFRRNLSQNSLKTRTIMLKLNKSMSPQRNFAKKITKNKNIDKNIEKNINKNI